MKILIATLMIGLPAVAGAQAMVEAAVGASRGAASVAGPTKKVGEAGKMENLNRTLQDSDNGKAAAKAAQTVSPNQRERNPATHNSKAHDSTPEKAIEIQYESPSGIREGIEVAELARRFGPPALKITGSDEETYCYVAKDGTSADVTVRGTKVASVQRKGDSSPGVAAESQQK